jgi:simple sugar transport system ATP-binding protein
MRSLEVRSVSKRYGHVQALVDISVQFRSGEIHGVLGENGAGKSTLVGILSGFVRPDSGEVLLDGVPVPLGSPSDCKRLGIQMIHQHFTLVPRFTGEENLALGGLEKLAGALDLNKSTERAQLLAKNLGWSLRLSDPVSTYSVGEQQRLEILRALSLGGDVIVFDEPTAVLSPDEVEDLLGVFRKLRDEGKIVILIAHKLSEVLSVADRVTVLKRGRQVGSDVRSNVNANLLAEWMVGEIPPLQERLSYADDGAPGLSVKNLEVLGSRGETAVREVSFDVKRGEIFGIGGVDGNGQIELAEALAGVRSLKSGLVAFGRDSSYHVSYIPQDRQTDGLAMGMSVLDNLLVTGHKRPDLSNKGFLRPTAIESWARGLIDRFQIKVSSPRDLVAGLSGGNGQKVIVSRSLDRLPDLLVAVGPTRGLDLKATSYVHEKIREVASLGSAVVLISTDQDEIAALATERVFLNRGQIFRGDRKEDMLGEAKP